MRNYKSEIEAAYMSSLRQGNTMRDREREQSTRENRKNRYLGNNQPNPGQRYDLNFQSYGKTIDSYRPAGNDYRQQIENHRGKGPRNYKRSDERIQEIISEAFSDDQYLDASEIEVQVKNGAVILEGKVEDRRSKWLAEDLAEDVMGVTHVENRLRIEAYRHNYHNDQVNIGLS